jgi:predicted dehydrogenase
VIKVGLLGAGFMGQVHSQAWSQVGEAELAAVAGLPKAAAAKLASSSGGMATDSLEEVISNEEVDVIDICLPTDLHQEYAIKALRAGKDVLCEKPLALSVESVDRILEAADQTGKTLMVAQVVRFWPEYLECKSILSGGSIGELKALRASRTSRRPNWGDWFDDPSRTGGALFDLHIHDLDYVVWLLGRPKSVFALGLKSEGGGWDHVCSQLDYGHSSALVEASYSMPDPYPFSTDLRLVCEDGTLEYQFRVKGNVEERSSAETGLVMFTDAGVTYPKVPETDGYLAEIEHFVECVKNGVPSDLVPNGEVRLVMEVVEALRASLEGGTPVRL